MAYRIEPHEPGSDNYAVDHSASVFLIDPQARLHGVFPSPHDPELMIRDLLAVLDDFSPQKAQRHLRELASSAPVYTLSARSGDGLTDWLDWLRSSVDALRSGEAATPKVQPEGGLAHAHAHAHEHTHG